MKKNFGRIRFNIRIILFAGLLCAVGLLWIIWPRCNIQAPCSCPNQIATNLQSQGTEAANYQEEESKDPQFMSDISFSVLFNNSVPANEAPTTRVIKAGEGFFRRESPPDLGRGRKEIFIKNRRDNWIINLFNKDALHYESSAQPTTVNVPVLYPFSGFKGELLIGEEVNYFVENNAQKTIEGKEVVYELKFTDGKLKLHVDIATDKPLKVEVTNEASPYRSHSVVYRVFERRANFNPQLFQVPAGVISRNWNIASEKQPQYEGWKSEDEALLNYYLKPDPQALLKVFEKLPSTGILGLRPPFIELAAAILTREPSLITSFVRVAKQSSPDLKIWAALALRNCKVGDCLNVLKTNPFGFMEDEFISFLDSAEKVSEQAGERISRSSSIDYCMADFVVTGSLGSLARILFFLDSRIEFSDQGEQNAGKPASLSTAPPGMVDIIRKIAVADPSVKTFLESKQGAKSRSASEILKTL